MSIPAPCAGEKHKTDTVLSTLSSYYEGQGKLLKETVTHTVLCKNKWLRRDILKYKEYFNYKNLTYNEV